jgi:hypothetical protein
MAKHIGGMQVTSGYYWNPTSWEVEVDSEEGGRLKGSPETSYVKVPFPLLFVIVPVLGGIFIIFLPLIGFALFAYAVVKKVTGGAKQAATELASTIQPSGFALGEAHMTGKKAEERMPGEKAKVPPELSRLEKEIAERKGEKK